MKGIIVLALKEMVIEKFGIDKWKNELVKAADAFGDYWVNVYSQKMYRVYYLFFFPLKKCKDPPIVTRTEQDS
jgi:hypothetical protein